MIGGFPRPTEIGASDVDPSARARFGAAVAVAGTGRALVVGAPEENAEAGAAYIFTRTADGWVQQARLTASDAEPAAEFGSSVAIDGDGDVVAIGSPEWDFPLANSDPLTGAGAVYVFVRRDGEWRERARLVAGDRSRFASFGRAVGLSGGGNSVAVGAPRHGEGTGAGYVFSRDLPLSTTWTERARLRALVAGGNDFFGTAIAISEDGRTVAVGAPGGSAGTSEPFRTGAVHIFQRPGGGWPSRPGPAATLTHANAGAGDWLGVSVALSHDGRLVVAAAPRHLRVAPEPPGRGAAFVFGSGPGGWSEVDELARFVPDRPDESEFFGSDVAIRHIPAGVTRVGVGDFSRPAGEQPRAGTIFLYRSWGARWSRATRISAPDARRLDEFGFGLSLNTGTGSVPGGPILVVGAPLGAPDTGRPGSAYVYDLARLIELPPAVAVSAPVALATVIAGVMVCLAVAFRRRA